ncbi:ATPase family associated with various cellular activities (AAA) [Crateriforma conspicua]|uniref:ATPase family associated with various cellular activities (AAA) n=2 Tax=Crateriforma conspicua TaxID=2527996 RepID=A0A5C5Y4L1_9PLAN|nr:MoxR family ATPase [Crateriforma conspicua]TWT69581.1 ATPase family associated with various cellular activities (AAA) [Crateriforma conspicua]
MSGSPLATPSETQSDDGTTAMPDPSDARQLRAHLADVQQSLESVIRDKSAVIERVLTAVLAGGSVLLEDVPGVGKTTLAKSVAALIDLKYQRIQCTPDLLPADILGGAIYQPSSGTFEFRPGPVFCNLLIADEINRASPRTQSALLEAMAESQVTIDGKRYDLEQPFIVIATQNPSGFEGTFPLPESQLDRFLMRLSMSYPNPESEVDLLLQQRVYEPSANLQPILHRESLLKLQAEVQNTTLDRKVAGYLVDIVGLTRRDPRLRVGCSPRGSKMLMRAAQAHALLKGRDFVLPDDVAELAPDVLSHRVVSRSVSATMEEVGEILRDIVSQVEVPV